MAWWSGLVLNVVDFLVWGVWLAPDMAAALQAAGKKPIDSLIPLFIVLDFVYGIALVQLYAAIRPRFGPGPGTAVKAGIFVWVLISLLHAIGEAPMGLLPMRLYTMGTSCRPDRIPARSGGRSQVLPGDLTPEFVSHPTERVPDGPVVEESRDRLTPLGEGLR